MRATVEFRQRSRDRQGGAALVVGLILLVVVTLMGISAMRDTTLEEKMAGNLRDSNLAFQASETALRHCENIVERDYGLQVALFSGLGVANPPVVDNPPQPIPRDQVWPLGGITPLPAWLPLPAGMPANIWVWSLDNGQAGVLFPGLAGNRLDPDPMAVDNRPWWAEVTGATVRDRAWWESDPSNSEPLPDIRTLVGLIGPPRCILEGYIYAAGDNSDEARAYQRSIYTDGLVIKNELRFRRERRYFRNTSRGMGNSDNAVAMLQTGVYMNYYVPN